MSYGRYGQHRALVFVHLCVAMISFSHSNALSEFKHGDEVIHPLLSDKQQHSRAAQSIKQANIWRDCELTRTSLARNGAGLFAPRSMEQVSLL